MKYKCVLYANAF